MWTLGEIKWKRFQFLQKLYEKTNGDRRVRVRAADIRDELGFSEKETNIIGQYLLGENLIEWRTGGQLRILHLGIVAVEEEMEKENTEPLQLNGGIDGIFRASDDLAPFG